MNFDEWREIYSAGPLMNEAMARAAWDAAIAAERRKHRGDIERWKEAAVTAQKWRAMALSKDGDGRTVQRIQQEAAAAERDRICKAIKEEDDYCVTEGDYMLDSDDCIAVAKGEWVRPDYSVEAIRARGKA